MNPFFAFLVFMISLTTPQPLAQAVASISARTPIGSALKSADWEDVPLALREAAQFSAGVESARVLQRIQDRLLQVVSLERSKLEGGKDGAYFDRQKFIAEMQKIAREEGLTPADPRDRGTVRDITSEGRLGLIFDIQTQRAAEFAKWKMEQDPDVLDAYPAQEFVRIEHREVPRKWRARWQALGGKFFGPDQRMIAAKHSAIWRKLSRFGTPWPPFDYNSGMGLEDISRDEAEELGVIKQDEVVPPAEIDFNEGLQASVQGLSDRSKIALKTIFGDQVNIEGDVAHWVGSSNPAPASAPARNPTPTLDSTPIPEPVPPRELVIDVDSLPPWTPPPEPAPPRATDANLEHITFVPLVEETWLANPYSLTPAPTATPLASKAVNYATGFTKDVVDDTFVTIGKLHGDGPLKEMPITNHVMEDNLATYWNGTQIGVDPVTGNQFSLAHEIGHWLDDQGLPSTGHRSASAAGEPLMQEWRTAVEASQAYRSIVNHPTLPEDYREYLLDLTEVWARSYAQYVANAAQHPEMLHQMEMVRLGQTGYPAASQWTDEDFLPIARAMAALFNKVGWAK